MATVLLSLGTNLGDKGVNLRRAIMGLTGVLQVTAVSRTYQTPPWGLLDQPAYWNLCLAGQTPLSPHDLLIFAKTLETRLGRQPGRRWGPRLIDIDILFYDDLCLDTESLTIPHPRLTERAFVLVPLLDIAPRWLHPLTGYTMQQHAALVSAVGVEPIRQEE